MVSDIYLSSEVGNFILHLTNFVGLVHRIGKISFHDHFLVLSEKNWENFIFFSYLFFCANKTSIFDSDHGDLGR